MRRLALSSLILATLLSTESARADEVVSFGDSWADLGWAELQAALQAAGFTTYDVDDQGIGGITADFYANSNPAGASTAVSVNPDARWMYLSLGGNDLLNLHGSGMGNQVAMANDINLRAILDGLFAQYPNIQVVMIGYDYLNFETLPMCQTQGDMIFGAAATAANINTIMTEQVGDVQALIALSYPNVTFIPVYGSLQLAAGVPGAPDPTAPSPASQMTDCVHPTPQGFRAIYDVLVAQYWGAPMPTAGFVRDTTPLCLGNTTTFTSTSVSALRLQWRVNGVNAGTGNTLVLPLNNTGAQTVQLRAHNNAWVDVSTRPYVVGSCMDAGFPDTGPPDMGFPDAGQDAGFPDAAPDAGPDAGFPDAGFPDAGFLDTGVFPDAGPDAGFDAEVDAGPDAGFQDAAEDGGFEDAGEDGGLDGGEDGGLDAGEDGGPDAFIDTGVRLDAGFVDSGIFDSETADTGAPDVIETADAGFLRDAQNIEVDDRGIEVFVGGCGCNAAEREGARSESLSLFAFAAILFALRRRR